MLHYQEKINTAYIKSQGYKYSLFSIVCINALSHTFELNYLSGHFLALLIKLPGKHNTGLEL